MNIEHSTNGSLSLLNFPLFVALLDPQSLSSSYVLCFLERKGHFCFVTAFITVLLTGLLIVLIEKDVLVMSCKVLATSVAFSVLRSDEADSIPGINR